MTTYSKNSVEQQAQEFRDQLFGNSSDFINSIADTLIDRLIDKDEEVCKLITSVVYRKLKSMDVEKTLKESIDKLMDEEFSSNVMGIINMRVCNLENNLYQTQSEVFDLVSKTDNMMSNRYVTYSDWYPSDVKFTSSWTLQSLIDRISYLEAELNNLITEVKNEREQSKNEADDAD